MELTKNKNEHFLDYLTVISYGGGVTYKTEQELEAVSPASIRYSSEKLYRFYGVAEALAGLSRDPSTKVAALAFGEGYEIRAQGWNGAPRRSKADSDARAGSRASRLLWTAHAELNLIANAARSGVSLSGCALLSTHMPCMQCAKAIVQAGFIEVMCPAPDEQFTARWGDELKATSTLFRECGVRLTIFSVTQPS